MLLAQFGILAAHHVFGSFLSWRSHVHMFYNRARSARFAGNGIQHFWLPEQGNMPWTMTPWNKIFLCRSFIKQLFCLLPCVGKCKNKELSSISVQVAVVATANTDIFYWSFAFPYYIYWHLVVISLFDLAWFALLYFRWITENSSP